MKTFIGILLFLILTSFIQTDNKKSTQNIQLSYFHFKDIPGQFGSDCSEQYAFDTAAIRHDKLIMFTDIDSITMLKINGDLIFFKMKHSEEHNKQRVTDFFAKGYKIKLISREIKKMDDEYFLKIATLEIEKEGIKKIFELRGIYSC